MAPVSLRGGGWQGRPRGLAGCPSPEERRQVKLGVTGQQGLCQINQNALPVPGMGPEAAEVHHSSAVSTYPRNPLVRHPVPPRHPSTNNGDTKCASQSLPTTGPDHSSRRQSLFPTVPRGRLLHFSGLLMFFSHSFWEGRIGMAISDLFFPQVNVVLHKL